MGHRLQHIDGERFVITHGTIERILQKIPLYQAQRMLHGPPSLFVEQSEGLYVPRSDEFTEFEQHSDGGSDASVGSAEALRTEALRWWREQRFSSAVPTRILASSLLNHLVDEGLHPDPTVAEGLPSMLERLFGVQITCDAFMNCLLPKLGGYVDSTGLEVHRGKGLPLLTDPACCAESLLVFLRQWCEAEDIACASGLPTGREAPKGLLNNTNMARQARLQR